MILYEQFFVNSSNLIFILNYIITQFSGLTRRLTKNCLGGYI